MTVALPRSLVVVCMLVLAASAPAADPPTVWKHDGGTFTKVDDRKWVEKVGTDTFELSVKSDNGTVVTLIDLKRKLSITLSAGKGAVVDLDGKVKPKPLKGDWVKAGDVKKPDPKATKPDATFTEAAVHKVDDIGGDLSPGFSPDGKFVARRLGPPSEDQLGVVELATGKTTQTFPKGDFVIAAAWSGDGKTLAAVVRGELNKKPSQVVVWETAKWKETARLDLPSEPKAVSVSADGKFVATSSDTGFGDHYAWVFDVAKKKVAFDVKTAKRAFTPPPVVLSADGKTAAVGRCGKDGAMIGLFDVPSGKPRGTFKGGSNFTLSADGGLLVEWVSSFDAGTTITIHDTKAGAKGEPRTIKDDKWVANSAEFLDGNAHLAVGVAQAGKDSRGGGVRVYDLKKLEPGELFTFGKPEKGEAGPRVWATPDSAFLLTQTNDRTLRLFRTPFGPKAKP